MKRLSKLLLLLLMFFPTIVFASNNVKIESVELDYKSDTTEVLSNPIIDGLSVNLSIKFHNIGDSIRYKITIRNNDPIEYEIPEDIMFRDSEYFNYSFIYQDGSNIVAANSNKVFYVVVEYVNEVPDNLLDNFVEENQIGSNVQFDIVETPNTSTSSGYLIAITIISLILVGLLIFSTRKTTKVVASMLLVLLPCSIYALENLYIGVYTKVSVDKDKYFCVQNADMTRSYYKYTKGETFKDFITRTNNEAFIDTSCSYQYQYSFQNTCDAKVAKEVDKMTFEIIASNKNYNITYQDALNEIVLIYLNHPGTVFDGSVSNLYKRLNAYNTIYNKNYNMRDYLNYVLTLNETDYNSVFNEEYITREQALNEEFNTNNYDLLHRVNLISSENAFTCLRDNPNAMDENYSMENALNSVIKDSSNGCYLSIPKVNLNPESCITS